MPETSTPILSSVNTYSPNLFQEYKQSLEWDIFETRLDETLAGLQKRIGTSVNLLRESQGKRLRPLLVFSSCSLFRSPNKNTIKAAIASELIHMASLVHDDIIDKSSMRRGKPSVNSLYGNHAAVLLGDALFAEAFRILASLDLLSSMHHFVRAIQSMCSGEIQQGQSQYDTNRSVNAYFSHISQKTGALIEASCQSGVETAQANDFQVEHLREFGDYLGTAFQIADDILDFVGAEETLGKPVLNDLRQGNFTLPVLLLLNDPTYSNWLKNILNKKSWQPTSIYQIQQAIFQSGALTKSKAMAEFYIDKAKTILVTLPYSPARVFLSRLCDSIVSKLP